MIGEKIKMLNEVLIFGEASEVWGLQDGMIRMMVRRGKLKEGTEYRKSARTLLITRNVMYNHFGNPKK